MSKTRGVPKSNLGTRRKGTGALLPDDVRQATWDEAIATIAGGFAHDANNCLTGIFSMSDLCLAQVDPQNPLYESLSLMRDSASQASQLLQRLTKLIYDVPGTRSYHDLNEITTETADILRRVLPRSVDLRLDVHKEPLPIFADAVELRQALICLALEAVEYVPGAARIEISTTAKAEAPEVDDALPAKLSPPLIVIEVSRTGQTPKDVKDKEASAGKQKASRRPQRLNMAKKFAEAHGGLLVSGTGESQERTVRLYLPRADVT